MDFLLDLLQGIGLAAAVGIRPFLPVLLAGALAAANLGLDFDGTDFAFLEEWPFLLGVLVLVAGLDIIGRRAGRDAPDRPPLLYALLALALALGALVAAGSVAEDSSDWWAGAIAGVAAAALGFEAARQLFGRVRRRLDEQAAAALPVYAEGVALARRGHLDPLPAARAARRRRADLAARGRPPARRREVRRTAHPALTAVPRPKKLVLAVIDAMKPAMLEQAVAAGRAPTLELLMQRGHHTGECVAAFPSVTPVCSASIATGTGPDRHQIPSMNWYHRDEERYVEYGTSFKASQAFGFKRSLTDTIYNMNAEHLSADTPTVFESLDDAGFRTAGTTYLMYRGRHRHAVTNETALTRIASAVFKQPVLGPREFFYADMFASRRTGCRSQLGLPGVRDQHAGCVAEHLVEHDLFDFLLLSLPGQRHPLAQARARRPGHVAGGGGPADRAHDEGRRRRRRVPRGPRGDRVLRSLAVAGRGRDRPVPRVRRPRGAAGQRRPRGPERPPGRDRRLPELARGADLRARPRRPREAHRARLAHAAHASRASTS